VYNDPEGPIFVISGGGGRSLCDIGSKSSFVVMQQEEYGIMHVKITDVVTKLMGTFYANDGKKLKDTFTTVK
jgi:hypothetical protein